MSPEVEARVGNLETRADAVERNIRDLADLLRDVIGGRVKVHAPAPEEEAWRSTPIITVPEGCPKTARLCKALRRLAGEERVPTYGALIDWLAAGNELTDVRQVGLVTAWEIEECLDAVRAKGA
jgi:hypothetical protein